jgi:small basic protein
VWVGKIIAVGIMAGLIVYLEIPEKLKPIGVVAFAVVALLIASIVCERISFMSQNSTHSNVNGLTWNYWETKYSGGLFSATLAILSFNSTIFLIRKTANCSNKRRLKTRMIPITFGLAGL